MDIDLDLAPGALVEATAIPDRPHADFNVGARVKSLRKERDWTLVETSKRTGLSLSALSKIERNELSPTLSSLTKIAAGFSIDVVMLLSSEAAPSQGRRSINRGAAGLAHPTSTCENIWFATDLRQKRMLPLKTRVTARKLGDYAEWPVHPGEIFVYVLKGSLAVHSRLYEPVVLREGDSIYYDGSTGHKWLTEGEEDAQVLWVYAE